MTPIYSQSTRCIYDLGSFQRANGSDLVLVAVSTAKTWSILVGVPFTGVQQ